MRRDQACPRATSPSVEPLGTDSPWTLLASLARSNAGGLTLASTYGILWLGLQALFPFVLQRALDNGVIPGEPMVIIVAAGVVAGLGLLQAVFGTLRRRISVFNALAAGYGAVQIAASSLYDGTAGAVPSNDGQAPRRGELQMVGTTDLNAIGALFDIAGRTVGAVVALVAVFILQSAISPVLAGLSLLLTLLALLAAALLSGPVRQGQMAYRHQQADVTAQIVEVGEVGSTITTYAAETRHLDRFEQLSQALRHSGTRVARTTSDYRAAQMLLPTLAVGVVIWVGARSAVAGEITVGELVAFYTYSAFLVEPVTIVLETVERASRAHASAARVVSVVDQARDRTSAGGVASPEANGPSDDVPRSRRWLRGLTAVIDGREAPGDYLDSCAGMVEDSPATTMILRNDDVFFTGRLRTELDLGGAADDREIHQVLRLVHAAEVVEELPAGLDSWVSIDSQLSTGQRQRLRLARAILCTPDVLVCLEPTSYLDGATARIVMDGLKAERADMSTVVRSTNEIVAERADQVVFINRDGTATEGTHAQLMASGDYREVLS